MGSSFGNRGSWLDTLGTGAVEQLFSVALGQTVVCGVAARYSRLGRLAGEITSHSRDDDEGALTAGPDATRLLNPETGTGEFEFSPGHQIHRFTLTGGVNVEETVFVPKTGDDDDRVILFLCCRVAAGDGAVSLRISALGRLRGETEGAIGARFNVDLNALVARNTSQSNWVRVFGCSVPVAEYAATPDMGQASDPIRFWEQSRIAGPGDLIGALHVDVDLKPHQHREVTFTVAFDHRGERPASEAYRLSNAGRDLAATRSHLSSRLSAGRLATPDPVINDGMQWAKANMLRVMAHYPQGPGFTNDPGHSVNIVVRDSCWFVLGCNYLLPSFSRAILEQIAARQEPNGMLVEYWNAVTGKTDDYGLSMNDNSALFLIALGHYWRMSADRDLVERLYDTAHRVARYIVEQEDDRGLVFVRAPGYGPHGIASWRNIIPNYQINGAVTEINAECVAALAAMGDLARALGRPDAGEFDAQAKHLRDAVNRHLINPANGLYYLNIDGNGRAHTDVTVDQVFPVMFGVAPKDVAYRIVNRLAAPDFSNEAGIRTVPRTALDYHPYRDHGLTGGVWPGVTWWCAYASARYYSGFHVNALRASYAAYQRDPRKNNTVPGQFAEWFDGESMVNLGMRLSPWEPPRFVWAAVEGVCGACSDGASLHVDPLIPADWMWLGMRDLPFRGSAVSFFAARESESLQLYALGAIETTQALQRFDRDLTDLVSLDSDTVHPIAFARDHETVVCLGNEAVAPTPVTVGLDRALSSHARHRASIFNSEDRTWKDVGQIGFSEKLVIRLDQGGYAVIKLIHG